MFAFNPELKIDLGKKKRNQHKPSNQGPLMKTMRVPSAAKAPVIPLPHFTCVTMHFCICYLVILTQMGKYSGIHCKALHHILA